MTPQEQAVVIERAQPANSITLTLTAKGLYTWEAKAYFPEGGQADAVALLAAIDAELRQRFPYPMAALPEGK